MQKNYNLVKASALLLLLMIQNSLQAQNRCLDCPADVKVITDKQVLLDKIEIQDGVSTKINTNLYVSYRSGNAQKFWANLAIATAGVAVSTQLQSNSSTEGNNANSISPLIPLGVSVATLPSIWKNRPRGVPQAGLWLQHRDTRGRLIDTWEQPISSEAKNSGELLSINIDKPLSAGTVEVYLQNGSKNPLYYWGYESSKTLVKNKGIIFEAPPLAFGLGCPDGYLSNGQGRCCNPFMGDCIDEPQGGGDGNPTPTPPPAPQGCPSGYLPNGQGMCCSPFTGDCVSEGNSGGGLPPNNDNNNPPLPPNPTPTINLQNAAQGCPSGFLSNGSGMCCNPFTGNCVSERAIHDPTKSNFVSSFGAGLTKPPCAIWVCYTPTTTRVTAGSNPNGGLDCGWLEYQCPTPPPNVPPFSDPVPTPPFGCGPDFTFNGTYCVPNNPNSGLSPFTPLPYTGTGTTGTGGTGSGNSSPSDIDRMDRRADVDDLCNGYKRLWNNSFRNNDPILTKEMGGLLTSNGKIILLPSYDNGPTTTSFKGSYLDQQGREILYFYTQQGQSKADVTIYDPFGHGVTTTYEITGNVHTHPYIGDGIHDTFNPSPDDIRNLASDTSIKHYILAGKQLIEYNQAGKIDTAVPVISCP